MSYLRIAAMTGLLSLLVVCTPASAAVVAGSIKDPDAARGSTPEQDLRAVTVSYDSAGSYAGALRLAAPPSGTSVSYFEVGFGRWVPRTWDCRFGDVGDVVQVFPPSSENPAWMSGLFIGPELGPDGSAGLTGTTVSFSVASPEGSNRGHTCAGAVTVAPDDRSKDDTMVFSLTREGGAGKRPPKCVLRTRRALAGSAIRLTCARVGKRTTTIRLYKDPGSRLRKTAKARIGRRGRVSVSTNGLRRGGYTVVAWRGRTMIGWGGLKLR